MSNKDNNNDSFYPSNSSVIDLRNKIVPASSKTKQFYNDLMNMTGSSSPSKTSPLLYTNRTYEVERWFTPRPGNGGDADTSVPPRLSMFTPSRLQSRLQNMSAKRSRETRKPYWRCPMPAAKPSGLSDIERILRDGSTPSSSLAVSSSPTTVATSTTTVTPSLRQAPMKSFIRRREPEIGKKTNVFSVDDKELDDLITQAANESDLSKVPALNIAPRAGFLGDASDFGSQQKQPSRVEEEEEMEKEFVFAFAVPLKRGPKCLTPPPPPKPIQKEASIQTETFGTQLTGGGLNFEGPTTTPTTLLPAAAPMTTSTTTSSTFSSVGIAPSIGASGFSGLFGSGAAAAPPVVTTSGDTMSKFGTGTAQLTGGLMNGGFNFGGPTTTPTTLPAAAAPTTTSTTTNNTFSSIGIAPSIGASGFSGLFGSGAAAAPPVVTTSGDTMLNFGTGTAQTFGTQLTGGFNFGVPTTTLPPAAAPMTTSTTTTTSSTFSSVGIGPPILASGFGGLFGSGAAAAPSVVTTNGDTMPKFGIGTAQTFGTQLAGGPMNGGFNFGGPATTTATTAAAAAPFQFGGQTMTNGNTFMFTNNDSASDGTVRVSSRAARKVLLAKRSKRP